MRRFLVHRKTTISGRNTFETLALGCEMWDREPVATISPEPPYRTRWFLNLDVAMKYSSWEQANEEFPDGIVQSIQLNFIDEQERAFFDTLSTLYHLNLSEVEPKLASFLQITGPSPTFQQAQPCEEAQPANPSDSVLPYSKNAANP